MQTGGQASEMQSCDHRWWGQCFTMARSALRVANHPFWGHCNFIKSHNDYWIQVKDYRYPPIILHFSSPIKMSTLIVAYIAFQRLSSPGPTMSFLRWVDSSHGHSWFSYFSLEAALESNSEATAGAEGMQQCKQLWAQFSTPMWHHYC